MKISWKITVSAEFRARDTAQKMKFSIEDFFSKCDEIRSFLRIWPHLLEKSLMENFIFCAVTFLRFFDIEWVQMISADSLHDLIIEKD